MMEILLFLIGNFILGLLAGIVTKRILKIGLLIIFMFLLASFLGYTNFMNITAFFSSVISEKTLQTISSILPYNNIVFVCGLIIGLLFL